MTDCKEDVDCLIENIHSDGSYRLSDNDVIDGRVDGGALVCEDRRALSIHSEEKSTSPHLSRFVVSRSVRLVVYRSQDTKYC